MNSNKKWLCVVLAFFCHFCYASSLLVFDSPSLMAIESGNSLRGYYGALEKGVSCMFFFTANTKSTTKTSDGVYSILDVKTYALSASQFRYVDRDAEWDIPGQLYVMGDQWIIETSLEPPGCGGAVGFFHRGPSDQDATRYYITKKIRAYGIRVVKRKTFFYGKRGHSFAITNGYLTPGDVVGVLTQNGDYSLVRYTNPDFFNAVPGKVTSGWVRSTDINDPFPQADHLEPIR